MSAGRAAEEERQRAEKANLMRVAQAVGCGDFEGFVLALRGGKPWSQNGLADVLEAAATSGPSANGGKGSWSSETCEMCMEIAFGAGAQADRRSFWAASRHGCVAAIESMVRHGADPNALYDRGFVTSGPLHAAAAESGGEPGAVEALLRLGADPNLVDGSGLTAMHVAACKMSWRVFEALVAAGGDPGIESPSGHGALAYARGEEGVFDEEEEAFRRTWAQALVDRREVLASAAEPKQGARGRGLAL